MERPHKSGTSIPTPTTMNPSPTHNHILQGVHGDGEVLLLSRRRQPADGDGLLQLEGDREEQGQQRQEDDRVPERLRRSAGLPEHRGHLPGDIQREGLGAHPADVSLETVP